MPDTFDTFFHTATGNPPYAYQRRLACGEGTGRPCESQLIAPSRQNRRRGNGLAVESRRSALSNFKSRIWNVCHLHAMAPPPSLLPADAHARGADRGERP